jgi:hypothetical protein
MDHVRREGSEKVGKAATLVEVRAWRERNRHDGNAGRLEPGQERRAAGAGIEHRRDPRVVPGAPKSRRERLHYPLEATDGARSGDVEDRVS